MSLHDWVDFGLTFDINAGPLEVLHVKGEHIASDGVVLETTTVDEHGHTYNLKSVVNINRFNLDNQKENVN